MYAERACAWMSGPKSAALRVPAAKWWLAISRGTLTRELRSRTAWVRPPVTCHTTPTFESPLRQGTKNHI